MNKQHHSNRTEFTLLLAVFLDLIGFGMVFPDFQLRAESFGAPGWLIGTALSSYFLVQVGASPRWGRVSDRVGRKPILVVCTLISAVSMIVYAFATDMSWLLAARVLAGLGGANVVLAQAYVADATASGERTVGLGRIGASVTAGLILGPVIGGWLAQVGGNMAIGLVAASASFIGALWLGVALPSVAPIGDSRPPSTPNRVSFLRSHPELMRLFLVALIGWFALACLEGTFGRLIHLRFGYGQLEFGFILGVEATVAMLIQGFFLPFVLRHCSEHVALRASYFLQGSGIAMMPFMPGMKMLVLAASIHGVGVGGANPIISGLASNLTPPDRQGELFGMLQSSRSLGFLIGPILGGLLFDWLPMSPYLLAAGILFVVTILVPLSK